MDQSSNDAEKRNWRERLGIGTKEMPKIAGEFAKPAEPVLVSPKGKSEPVVVAKPAPMAPRVASKPVAAPQPASPVPARPQASPAPSAAAPERPRSSVAPSPEALAEKLRHQREAAEKLAEQRVHNAKEQPESPKAAVQPPPAQIAAPAARPPQGGSKPKFSFAEEEAVKPPEPRRDPRGLPQQGRPGAGPQARPGQPPQMSPSRPPLGGERMVTPQVPPPTRQIQSPVSVKPPGFTPPYRPQPQPNLAPPGMPPQGYRPIDPATGFAPPPSFPLPPRGPVAAGAGPRPAPLPPPTSYIPDPRLQAPAFDPYAQPQARGAAQAPLPRYDQLPPPQMRNDQLRGSNHSFDGDFSDDIFEEPAPKAVRRANVNDYSQAYHPDQDLDYGVPSRRKRSTGPIILLSLLFLAALAGIGGVFYYNKFISGGVQSGGATGEAPVVATPEQPAKVSPDQPLPDANANNTAAQPSKKQIYDRIVGDKEVLGGANQIVPTEEAPVQPAAGQSTAPAAIPAPDAAAPAAQGGQSGDEPLPLPMPPPQGSNGTQGAVDLPQTQKQASASPVPSSAPPAITIDPAPVPTPAPAAASNQTGYTAEQNQQMAAVSEQKTVIEDAPASPAAATVEEPAAPVVKAKPKVATAAPKKKVAAPKKLGSKPVVLVPEQGGATNGEQLAATQDPAVVVDGEPPLQDATVPAEAPVKKKKTLLGMFNGDNKKVDEQAAEGTIAQAPIDQAAPAAPAAKPKQQQVASVETPEAQPVPRARATGGNGYVLQLASYSTQAEAQQAYSKIANNGAVASLQPTITPVSIGGSTRYRLTLGPIASSTQASSACAKLMSAGQPDCLVKREQ